MRNLRFSLPDTVRQSVKAAFATASTFKPNNDRGCSAVTPRPSRCLRRWRSRGPHNRHFRTNMQTRVSLRSQPRMCRLFRRQAQTRALAVVRTTEIRRQAARQAQLQCWQQVDIVMSAMTAQSGARDNSFFFSSPETRRWAWVYGELLTRYIELGLNVPIVARRLRPPCRQLRNIKTDASGWYRCERGHLASLCQLA
jgi:hypothetical protein